MGNLTIIMYLTGGTLSFLVSLFMFGSFINTKKPATGQLSAMFFFIGLHSFSFPLSIVFSSQGASIVKLGYVVGIASIFFLLFIGLEVQRFMTRGGIKKNRVITIDVAILILAIISISMIAIYPTNPIFLENGIIIWNLPFLAQWIVGLTSLVYGIFWGIIFYRGAFLVHGLQSRFKFLVISADGYLLGLAAFLIFTVSNSARTLSGHIIFVIAGILTLSIYLIPKRFFTI